MERYPLAAEGERRQHAWWQKHQDTPIPERLKLEAEAEANGYCRDCHTHKAKTSSGRCKPCQDERDQYYEEKCNFEALLDAPAF